MFTGRCRFYLDEGAYVGKVGVYGVFIGEVLVYFFYEVVEIVVG